MSDTAKTLLDLHQSLPDTLWQQLCAVLSDAKPDQNAEDIIRVIAAKISPTRQFELLQFLNLLRQKHTWREIACALELAGSAIRYQQDQTQLEILWTGPDANTVVRRIDQVLYDLINSATERILLVTFAASHIKHLNSVLENALARSVHLRMVLEFEQASGGQLSFDALRAFSPNIRKNAEIYYWPSEVRERNQAGRTGKLHAKCAVVDDKAIISSANLTDDAFNRNIELGVLAGENMAEQIWQQFGNLSETSLKEYSYLLKHSQCG